MTTPNTPIDPMSIELPDAYLHPVAATRTRQGPGHSHPVLAAQRVLYEASRGLLAREGMTDERLAMPEYILVAGDPPTRQATGRTYADLLAALQTAYSQQSGLSAVQITSAVVLKAYHITGYGAAASSSVSGAMGYACSEACSDKVPPLDRRLVQLGAARGRRWDFNPEGPTPVGILHLRNLVVEQHQKAAAKANRAVTQAAEALKRNNHEEEDNE